MKMQKIGSGTYSVVYLDVQRGCVHKTYDAKAATYDAEYEYGVLKQLSACKYPVPRPFALLKSTIVMEYWPGKDLPHYSCTEERFLQVTKHLLRDLILLHMYGIHGDIKPENIRILLNEEGQFVTAHFLDWGLFCTLHDLCPGDNVYTPLYRPPELWGKHQEVSVCTVWDIWALGATLYEWYTGKCVMGTDRKQLNMELIDVWHKKGCPIDFRNIPFRVSTVLQHMLNITAIKRISAARLLKVIY